MTEVMSLKAAVFLLLFSVLYIPHGVRSQSATFSAACTYTPEDYTWSCDSQLLHVNSSLQNLVRLNYTDFQIAGNDLYVLKMANHHGYMPHGTFNGFAARTVSPPTTATPPAANPIPDPALIFDCDWSYQGFVGFENTTFAGMNWVRHLSFYNCDFWIYPDGSFSHFDNLYTLTISGGNLNNLDSNTFMGMNVQPVAGVPGSGAVYISAKVPSPWYWFPVYFFDPLANMTSLTLKDNYMRRIFSSMIWRLPDLEYLELSGQDLFYLPTTLFDRSNALSYVKLHDYKWFCACSSEWWVWYLNDRAIPWDADQVCSFPASEAGKTLGRYGDETCRPNPSLDITAKLLECIFSCILLILAGLVWLNVLPLWKKVIIQAIVNEWAEIPFNAVAKPQPLEEEETPNDFTLDVEARDDRDVAAMERKVKQDIEKRKQKDDKMVKGLLGGATGAEANKI